MELVNCDKWFYALLFTLGLFFIWSLIIFNYYFKLNRRSIELGKNDEKHEIKHKYNENRIKELEKKNGHEQHQINELKEEVRNLKNGYGNRTKFNPN